jgi:hypothetical protein
VIGTIGKLALAIFWRKPGFPKWLVERGNAFFIISGSDTATLTAIMRRLMGPVAVSNTVGSDWNLPSGMGNIHCLRAGLPRSLVTNGRANSGYAATFRRNYRVKR